MHLKTATFRQITPDDLRGSGVNIKIVKTIPAQHPARTGDVIANLTAERHGQEPEAFSTHLTAQDLAALAAVELSRVDFTKGEAKKILRRTGPHPDSLPLSYRMFQKLDIKNLVERGEVRLGKELSTFEKIGRLQGGALASVFVKRGTEEEESHVLLDKQQLDLLLQIRKKHMVQSLKQSFFNDEDAEKIADAVLLYRNYPMPEDRFGHDQFRPLPAADQALLTDSGMESPGVVVERVFPVAGEYAVVKLIDRRGSAGERSSESETHVNDSSDDGHFFVHMPIKQALQIMRPVLVRKENGSAKFTKADVDFIMTVIDRYRDNRKLEERLDHSDLIPFNRADFIQSGSQVTLDSSLSALDGRVLVQVTVTQGNFSQTYKTVMLNEQAPRVLSKQKGKRRESVREKESLNTLKLSAGPSGKEGALLPVLDEDPSDEKKARKTMEGMDAELQRRRMRFFVNKFAAQYKTESQGESGPSDSEDSESESGSEADNFPHYLYDYDSAESGPE